VVLRIVKKRSALGYEPLFMPDLLSGGLGKAETAVARLNKIELAAMIASSVLLLFVFEKVADMRTPGVYVSSLGVPRGPDASIPLFIVVWFGFDFMLCLGVVMILLGVFRRLRQASNNYRR
jgi:hypothetical protein